MKVKSWKVLRGILWATVFVFLTGVTHEALGATDSLAGKVIAINPGHHPDGVGITKLEYMGPAYEAAQAGAAKMKAGATSGATGVYTHHSEGKLTYAVATKLAMKLREMGAKVVFIDTAAARVTNKERALRSNESDLAVSIHFDSNDNPTVTGATVLVLEKNPGLLQSGVDYASIIARSKKIAAIFAANLNKDENYQGYVSYRGTVSRTDLTGLNWTKVPTFYVEGGFLSNPKQDQWIGSHIDEIADLYARTIHDYFLLP